MCCNIGLACSQGHVISSTNATSDHAIPLADRICITSTPTCYRLLLLLVLLLLGPPFALRFRLSLSYLSICITKQLVKKPASIDTQCQQLTFIGPLRINTINPANLLLSVETKRLSKRMYVPVLVHAVQPIINPSTREQKAWLTAPQRPRHL